MKKEVAERWVEELRSGKFEQGTGALKRPTGVYCCLGVLCELYRQEHPETSRWDKDHPLSSGDVPFAILAEDAPTVEFAEVGNLPDNVKQWAGMSSINGRIGTTAGLYTSLATLNDGGKSFLEIAEIIEQKVEVL